MSIIQIELREFNPDRDTDQFAVNQLWEEYGDHFALKQSQSEYYYNEFTQELQELKELKAHGKQLYLFCISSSPFKVIGMSILCTIEEPNVCEIKKVIISKEHRGCGYGKAAMELLLREAQVSGYTKCVLDVLKTESESALAVYKKVGFNVVKTTTFKTENDVLWMEKAL